MLQVQYQKSLGDPNHIGGVITPANSSTHRQNVIFGKMSFISSSTIWEAKIKNTVPTPNSCIWLHTETRYLKHNLKAVSENQKSFKTVTITGIRELKIIWSWY